MTEIDTLNPRSFGPFETAIDNIQVVYASFWEVTLTTGQTVSLLNDQVDPCCEGITSKEDFRNLVKVEDIYGYARKEGWAARPLTGFLWTKLYKSKNGAVAAAIKAQEAERKKPRGGPSPFAKFKGRKF